MSIVPTTVLNVFFLSYEDKSSSKLAVSDRCPKSDLEDTTKTKASGKALFLLRPTVTRSLFVIENGRKSVFPQAKFSPHRYSKCHLFVNLWFWYFHGGISMIIRTELEFEVHDTRRSARRRVGRSTGVRHVRGCCESKASHWTRKELSISQRTLTLTEHPLIAVVVVRKKSSWDSLVWLVPAARWIYFA